MSELVLSTSVVNLLQKRDGLVERLTQAHHLIKETEELASNLFGEEYRGHSVGLRTAYTHFEFSSDRGLEELVKEIDGRGWSYLLRESGLKAFLDAEARKKWETAIQKNDVPPLTWDNVQATFKSLYDARGAMFERGVVEVFRSLSWDYKTNNPVAFGKRLVLRHIVSTYKMQIFGVEHSGADKLDDLTRVMSVLDGKPEPDNRNSTYLALSKVSWPKITKEADLAYFSLKGFKNGNAHLTFKRPDLVDKMNLILAKSHPNALPPTQADG
jgi:hypothetical protein